MMMCLTAATITSDDIMLEVLAQHEDASEEKQDEEADKTVPP